MSSKEEFHASTSVATPLERRQKKRIAELTCDATYWKTKYELRAPDGEEIPHGQSLQASSSATSNVQVLSDHHMQEKKILEAEKQKLNTDIGDYHDLLISSHDSYIRVAARLNTLLSVLGDVSALEAQRLILVDAFLSRTHDIQPPSALNGKDSVSQGNHDDCGDLRLSQKAILEVEASIGADLRPPADNDSTVSATAVDSPDLIRDINIGHGNAKAPSESSFQKLRPQIVNPIQQPKADDAACPLAPPRKSIVNLQGPAAVEERSNKSSSSHGTGSNQSRDVDQVSNADGRLDQAHSGQERLTHTTLAPVATVPSILSQKQRKLAVTVSTHPSPIQHSRSGPKPNRPCPSRQPVLLEPASAALPRQSLSELQVLKRKLERKHDDMIQEKAPAYHLNIVTNQLIYVQADIGKWEAHFLRSDQSGTIDAEPWANLVPRPSMTEASMNLRGTERGSNTSHSSSIKVPSKRKECES